jgi:hypothetical protein
VRDGERRRSRVQRFVGSALFAAVTAAFAATVGLLGSVYQSEIARAFPLNPTGRSDDFSVRTLVFWTALGLLAFMVYLRQVADDEVRTKLIETTKGAERTSRRIEDFVQTLPPRRFQTDLQSSVIAVHNAVSAIAPRRLADNVSTLDLGEVIRAALHSLASLGLSFDDRLPSGEGRVVYSANIMAFVPRDVIRRSELRFFAEDQDLNSVRGGLRILAALSATSDERTGPSADANLPQISLPVPLNPKQGDKFIALPGAPLAFITGNVTGYLDTATLAKWCEDEGDFRPSVVDEVRAYFSTGPGKDIRSFVSTRLNAADGSAVGVLNLHANRTDLLGPRPEKRDTFLALSTPILQDLADAVQSFLRSQAAELQTRVDDATITKGGGND